MKHLVINLEWKDSFLYRFPEDQEVNIEVEIARLVYALQEGNQYWKDADFTAEAVFVDFHEPVLPINPPKKPSLSSVKVEEKSESDD